MLLLWAGSSDRLARVPDMLSGRISGFGLVVMRVHLLRERLVHFVADFWA